MIKAAKRSKIEEKSSWQGKIPEKKEQKKGCQENIVDEPFESNINTVVEKYLIRNYTS